MFSRIYIILRLYPLVDFSNRQAYKYHALSLVSKQFINFWSFLWYCAVCILFLSLFNNDSGLVLLSLFVIDANNNRKVSHLYQRSLNSVGVVWRFLCFHRASFLTTAHFWKETVEIWFYKRYNLKCTCTFSGDCNTIGS